MNSSIKAGLAVALPPARDLEGVGGRRLSFCEYPAENPWLHLLISHGFGEHRGWYHHVALTFQAAGVSTYIFDHFHHGTSSGKPGDVADYGDFSLGLRMALEQGVAPRRGAGEPLVLLGHSNGALAILRTLGELPPGSLAGVVLSNPLLGLPPALVKWGMWAARLLTPLAPGLMIPSRSVPARLTSDTSLWEDYGRDPLRLRSLSVRFFRQMTQAARLARREASCHAFPLLLLFGEDDPVVRRYSTMAWYARVRAPSTRLIKYPGLRHELFNEKTWRLVLEDVLEWLRSLTLEQGREPSVGEKRISGSEGGFKKNTAQRAPHSAQGTRSAAQTTMPTVAITLIGHNEGHLLPRVLESVSWADEIVYVDCESQDDSLQVARRYTDRVFSQPNRANLNINKSYAMEQATADWIFYLDPDEVVPLGLAEEIKKVIGNGHKEVAYKLPRRNFYFGRWLRHGGAYPDRQLRLFQRGKAHFPCKDVHEYLQVDGAVGRLKQAMDHYPSTTLLETLRKIDFYSTFHGRELAMAGKKPTILMALRYMLFLPLNRFISRYVLKRGFLDGWPGFLHAVVWSMDFQMRFLKFWHFHHHPDPSPEKPAP